MIETTTMTDGEIEHEDLTSKMDDDKLLAQIKLWENEGDTFYGEFSSQVEQNIQYYLGNQTDVNQIFGRESKAVENRIWMAIETMIPIVTARLPDSVVKSLDDDEQSQIDAQNLQDTLNYEFDRVSIQQIAERWTRDMLLKRMGIFKWCWNYETDDVDLKLVDPKRIRIPKFGKSVQALAFTIEDLEMSYGSLVEFFGESKAKEISESAPKISDNKVRKATYSIKETWTNDYVCWSTDSKVLKKEENPYYNFKNKKKNFFDAPRKPYVIKSLFETDESLVGSTDYVQQILRMQDNINTRKRQIENITGKVANPPLLIDSDVMSEEEAGKITNEEGVIIYGKGAASEGKIRFATPGQVPQYLFQDLEFSRKEFDNIVGLHASSRGEREGRETLGGRQLLKEADLGRIDLLGRQVERALDEIAEGWTQLIKLFWTEERTISVLGPEGIRFVKNFTGSKIGNVKPMVKPGSTIKEDEYSIKQQAIILWQNKAIGIQTLYKMLRIPNIDQAIQDWQQTQGGGAAAPVEQPGQPVV